VGSSKSRTIHCRIIAATNVLLEEKVDMGLFRMDLFYRLKRLVIKVPPLRERKLDINFLAEYFLNLNADASNKYELSPELKDAFLNYPWPGNVRELKNEIEKMSFLNADRKIFKIEDAEFLNLNNKLNKQNKNKIEDIKTENNTTKAKSPSDKNENIILESGAYFRRIENIMDLFIKHKKLTRKEICQITGAHNFTIGRDLKNLIAQNKIIKVAPTKSPRTHYFEIKP
jgi:transcriptional regulator with PAS, ATPase and Fis domain